MIESEKTTITTNAPQVVKPITSTSEYQTIPTSEKDPFDVHNIIEDIETNGIQFNNPGKYMKMLQNMKKYVFEGENLLKQLALGTSVVLFILGLFGFLSDLFSLNVFGAAMNALFCVIGTVCGLYEFDSKKIPQAYATYMSVELHILSTPFGRSIVYFVTGVIMMSQGSGNWFDLIIGLAVAASGGYIFYYMRKAEAALATMKAHVADEKQLAVLFKQCDLDQSGFLDKEEVAKVCILLGSTLDASELAGAISLLDNGEGKVSFESFKAWYSAHK